MSFILADTTETQIDVVANADGSLTFTLRVQDSGEIADLRGFFFDLDDPTLADGLSVTGDDVTGSRFGAGKVASLGKGCNMKGNHGSDSEFDGGVSFGRPGMAKGDDLQEVSFTLSHDEVALTLDDLDGMDFGLRLTSVGDDREGSLKLVGEFPEVDKPDIDDPKDDDDDDDEGPVVLTDVVEAGDDDTDPDDDTAGAGNGTPSNAADPRDESADHDLPLVDATPDELAELTEAGEVADEMAELPEFLF